MESTQIFARCGNRWRMFNDSSWRIAAVIHGSFPRQFRAAATYLTNCWRTITTIAVCCLFGTSLAAADDLSPSQPDHRAEFRQRTITISSRIACNAPGNCIVEAISIFWVSLRPTEVDGKNRNLSKVELTLNGTQYRYVLATFTAN